METSKRRNVETSKCVPLLLLVILFGGCEGTVSKPADKAGVSQSARSDLVTLNLSATPAEVDPSQLVHLELEVLAAAGTKVMIENYGRQLTADERAYSSRVVRSDELLDRPMADGRRRWLYRYELEFYLADRYELPGAKLSYTAGAASTPTGGQGPEVVAPEAKTLETEPLTIVVRESSTANLSPEELRRIAVLDPIDLPRLWQKWGWWAAPALLLVVAWLVWYLRRRRAAADEVVIPVPAHEWAYVELARLTADDLVAKNLKQEFFYRLSDIVRGYIERRFAVSAPEMTTEEFLAAATQDHRFERAHNDELVRFLTECDLVKYARHEPAGPECDGVLKAARQFIERTRERQFAATAGVSGPPSPRTDKLPMPPVGMSPRDTEEQPA